MDGRCYRYISGSLVVPGTTRAVAAHLIRPLSGYLKQYELRRGDKHLFNTIEETLRLSLPLIKLSRSTTEGAVNHSQETAKGSNY